MAGRESGSRRHYTWSSKGAFGVLAALAVGRGILHVKLERSLFAGKVR